MSVALPKVVDYNEPMYSLPPNTQSFQVVCNPISGSVFSPSSSIDFDLGSRGFLVPNSLFIRYRLNVDINGANPAYMCGTPVYTPFLRLAVNVNSMVTENINNYNVICNMLTNLTKDTAQKLGEQFNYGYGIAQSVGAVDNENIDGGLFSADGVKTMSAPLICSLSNCEKLIPLFLLNGIRLTFTLDTIANMFSKIDNTASGTAAVLPDAVTLDNFEVVYQCVDMGDEVKNMVSSLDRIRIKTQTFASSIQPLAANVSGQQNLIYNHKFSSVKSLFLNMGGTDRTSYSANGNFDSYNVAYQGDYSFIIGERVVPQRALSAGNNSGGIITMLRQAIGSVYDKNNAMSINAREFTSSVSNTKTTTVYPSKFWVACSTEKLKVAGSFFTGVSTESSPISAVINVSTATTQGHNVMLIVNADLIYEIDPQTKQIVVIQ